MAIADYPLAVGIGHDAGSRPRSVSFATLGAVAAVLLIYVSSSFQMADIFGVKRIAQVLLIAPIGASAAYYLGSRPTLLLHPLALYAIARLATELALRDRASYVLDSVSAVFALSVLICAPARSFETATRVLVTTAGVLALMAILQWLVLAYDPRLNMYVLEPIDEGEIQRSIDHPIALLGLVLPHEYQLGGITVGRMQSFAKEPSLNVVYFMFPACIALMRGTLASVVWGAIMVMYCVLSLSGSVFLTCAFAGMWWVATFMVPVRVVLPYGMVALMVAYVSALHFSGLAFLQVLDLASQFGDFLSKSSSASARGAGAVNITDAALISPFGSATTSELPGPWMSNSALTAGWIGVLFLLWFLVKLGRELDTFERFTRPFSPQRLGCVLLLGVLATVIVFNDYQMSNYAGVVLVYVVYRTLQSRNQLRATVSM
jgi:hypothetical protein